MGSSYTALYAELEGSPPLWITHITGTYHDDVFVNNARILVSQSNIQGTRNGKEQVHLLEACIFYFFAFNYIFNIKCLHKKSIKSYCCKIRFFMKINVYQVLHKIDEVLVPTTSPDSASNRLFNPTALDFLENYELLIQHPYRVR